MTKTRLLIRDLTVNAAWFLWLYAVFAWIAFWAYRDTGPIYSMLWLALPFMGLWLIRRYCKKMIFFVLLHLALVAAVFALLLFLPLSGLVLIVGHLAVNLYIVCCVLFLLAALLYSLITRFGGHMPSYDTGLAVFFTLSLAVACLSSEYYGYGDMAKLLTFIVILLLALKYLFSQMYSMDYSLDIISKTSSQPVASILSFNNKLIMIFVGLLLITALAANGLGFESGLLALLLFLWRGIRFVLRWLFSFIGESPEPEPYVPPADNGGGSDLLLELPDDYVPPSTPLFLVVLEKIMIYAAVVLMAAIVLGGIAYGCYQLYKRFYRRREIVTGDVAESVLPDFAASVKARFSFVDGGPANRIRRLFYRKVRKHWIKRTAPLQFSDTAGEMAKKIKASEDIDALAARYQQARYDK